tara:strand:- start:299 stop:1195 length:897 start_codon:yes stop_codon:yes gene_type:complete
MTYKENEVLFEGKSLKVWNDMTDDELRGTLSYKEALKFNDEDKKKRIEQLENELETTDYPEYNKKHRYQSRSRIKEDLSEQKERNIEVEALESVKKTLKQTNERLPNGKCYTTEASIIERGWDLMDSRGWLSVDIYFYGGNDSGGVDTITYEGKEGKKELYWSDICEINEDLKRLFLNQDKLDGLLLKFTEASYNRLLTPSIQYDDPLCDPVNDKFGWNGNFSRSGSIFWDNRKTKLNCVKEFRDGKHGEYPIDDTKSIDEMIPNPDYRKEPVFSYEESEMVGYTGKIGECQSLDKRD